MRRLYRPLKYVLGTLIGLGILWRLAQGCFLRIIRGKSCEWQPALAYVDTHYPWIVLFLFVLGGLTWFARRDYRRDQVGRSFDLLKPANELNPKDLGFRAAKSEEETELEEHVALNQRPFYESTYVSRLAVLYERRAKNNPQPYYDEDDLVDSLCEGKGFVLIGPPADGKTRTLYEIVRHMDDYEVLRLKADEKIPQEGDLSLLLKGKRIVLLLDDLSNPKYREPDLLELARRLRECEVPWVIASTCQDGSELMRVQTELGRLFDGISLMLWLVAPTAHQKRQLAESIWDKPWDPERSDDYPTLGSIAMAEAMATMRRRFNVLLHEHREQAHTLRALKLLVHAGVLPYTHERLRAVLKHEQLFRRRDPPLHQTLENLAGQAFLRSGSQEPIQPESAYLRYVVTYTPGKEPEDDFPKLADVLEGMADTEGLFKLGTTYALYLDNYEEARTSFERAVRLRSGDPQTLLSKGEALLRLGKRQARSAAFEEAAKSFEESLNSTKEAIRLKPDYPEAWCNKANALIEMGLRQSAFSGVSEVAPDPFFEEALNASQEAIRLTPYYPEAWFNKGQALLFLGIWKSTSAEPEETEDMFREALNAYDEATRLRPDYTEAWLGKSRVWLQFPGYSSEALEACEEAIRFKRDNASAWDTKSKALYHLGRHQESVDASKEAIRLRPNDPHFWFNLGNGLIALAKQQNATNSFHVASATFEEAINACEEAIRLKRDFPQAWFDKIVALDFLERDEEALSVSEEALRLWPEDPNFWFQKGVALGRLGRRDEAVQLLCRVWHERSRCSVRVGTVADFLREFGGDPGDCQ